MPKKTKEQKVRMVSISLTNSEINNLEQIAEMAIGRKNKSGMIRFWINNYMKELKDKG